MIVQIECARTPAMTSTKKVTFLNMNTHKGLKMPIWILQSDVPWFIEYVHLQGDVVSEESGISSSTYDKPHYEAKTSTVRIKVKVNKKKIVNKMQVMPKDPSKFITKKQEIMTTLQEWAKTIKNKKTQEEQAKDEQAPCPSSRSREPAPPAKRPTHQTEDKNVKKDSNRQSSSASSESGSSSQSSSASSG